MIDRNKIRIPHYQREKVWSTYQKQLLIDSLIRNIDIPKFYFTMKLEKVEGRDQKYFNVVDGQQRLSTIIEFARDEFKLMEESGQVEGHEIMNLKFSQLDIDTQTNFHNVQLDIVILVEWSEEDEKEMFSRLQEGTPLNMPEKRRSYPGIMPDKIIELSKHRFFSNETLLKKFKNKRYAYEDICAQIFHQFYNGSICEIKPFDIKATYKESADGGQKVDRVMKEVEKSFDLTLTALEDISLKEGLKKYSMLRIPFLLRHIKSLYAVDENMLKQIGKAYEKFEEERIESSQLHEDDRDPKFDTYMLAARSRSIGNQTQIHDTLLRYILSYVPSLTLKDKKRNFTENQRWVLFKKANGQCQADTSAVWYNDEKCANNDLTWDGENKCEADHIKPYSKGGPTSIENGQALCGSCNRAKSNRI